MTQMCTAVNGNNAECVTYLSSGPGATRRAGQFDTESLRSGLQIKHSVSILCVFSRPCSIFANVKGNQLHDRVKLCDLAESITSAWLFLDA